MNITLKDGVRFTPGRILATPEVAPHVRIIPYIQLRAMLLDHCCCLTVEFRDGTCHPCIPLSLYRNLSSVEAVAKFSNVRVQSWQRCAIIPEFLFRFVTDFETGTTTIDDTLHLETA